MSLAAGNSTGLTCKSTLHALLRQLFKELFQKIDYKFSNAEMWQIIICLEARVGLMHIGVFILLLLSGERNFGVRLNKPYTIRIPMDIPVFTGTHADFLIIVSNIWR